MFWFDEIDYRHPTQIEEQMSTEQPKKTPRYIVLSGKKQVGKDTAAGMIRRVLENEGKRVAEFAFAKPLKDMCVQILGISREGAYGTDAQKNALSHIVWDGMPPAVRMKYAKVPDTTVGVSNGMIYASPRSGPMTNREVLQVIGTDIFRSIYNDVWAKAPFNIEWDVDIVILTDCRFPNEKSVTEESGGVIIRLERITGLSDNHISETALDGFTFKNTYHNDGSLQDLEQYIRQVLVEERIING